MAFSTTHAGTVDGAWYHLLHPASGLLVELFQKKSWQRIETNLPVHPAKPSIMEVWYELVGIATNFSFEVSRPGQYIALPWRGMTVIPAWNVLRVNGMPERLLLTWNRHWKAFSHQCGCSWCEFGKTTPTFFQVERSGPEWPATWVFWQLSLREEDCIDSWRARKSVEWRALTRVYNTCWFIGEAPWVHWAAHVGRWRCHQVDRQNQRSVGSTCSWNQRGMSSFHVNFQGCKNLLMEEILDHLGCRKPGK